MNDFIRKISILDKISESISLPADNEFDHGYNTAMAEIKEWVKNQDNEPIQKGYWKPIMMSEATGWDLSLTGGYDEVCEYVCSCCGESNRLDEFGKAILSNFCPDCGADLREETFEIDELGEEIELKPCPFCGEKPNVTYITNDIGNKEINIECDNSKCGVVLFTRLNFVSDDVIIKAWNTRAEVKSDE